MTKKALIKRLVKESIYNKHNHNILAEMDIVSTIQDILPYVNYLMNIGFLTYHGRKLLLKKCRQSEAAKEEIKRLAAKKGFSIENFKNSAYLDKTQVKGSEATIAKPEDTDHISFNSEYFFDEEESTEEDSTSFGLTDDTLGVDYGTSFPAEDPDTEVREYFPKPRPLNELEDFVKNKRKNLKKYWSKK